jgi:hypothetical protein
MKILILSLSFFDNGIYSKFYKTQKSTWDSINVDGISTMYYVGNSEEEKVEGNIIYTTTSESLENAGYKTLKAFELTKDIPYDVIYRTNASSYVDKLILKKFISDKDYKSIYCGVIGHHAGFEFASGSGYFISKDLVNYVLENKDLWDHGLIDDVALAKLLNKINTPVLPAPRYQVYPSDRNIPLDYFHYRFKNNDRSSDCELMNRLHTLKNEFYNR